MNRSSRLTRNEDIKHVRQEGQSYAHRSIVLYLLPNQYEINRIAIVAGRSVGGAVQRNLAKRRIRSAFQSIQQDLSQAFDVVLIARKAILTVPYDRLLGEIETLFRKSGLLKDKEID
ncbi:MAG: ribonuclease P protein component [Anaerolineaceae bacterium]|nr:ribonuclease P protein component [Anaerolineaceae bacterium]